MTQAHLDLGVWIWNILRPICWKQMLHWQLGMLGVISLEAPSGASLCATQLFPCWFQLCFKAGCFLPCPKASCSLLPCDDRYPETWHCCISCRKWQEGGKPSLLKEDKCHQSRQVWARLCVSLEGSSWRPEVGGRSYLLSVARRVNRELWSQAELGLNTDSTTF